MIEHLPLIVCVVDDRGIVSLASWRYVELASGNPKLLPLVGEKWRTPNGDITMLIDGTKIEYSLKTLALPEHGAEMHRFEPS